MLTRTAQVEVAVFQAGVFADTDMVVDLEGQRRRGVEYLELGNSNLNLTGRQIRVGITLWTGLNDSRHLDAVFVAQVVGARGLQDLVADDDLGQA